MKKLKIIGMLLLLFTAALFIPAQSSAQNFDADPVKVEGRAIDQVQVSIDTNSNGITKTYIIPNIKDYKKITFFTGSTNNDSASYVFSLYGGTGGMWILLWNDTITCLKATQGIVSATDTSAARKFTYDMTDSTDLVTELKWIRRNLATGNGTGPATNKTKANDFFVGYKPEY